MEILCQIRNSDSMNQEGVYLQGDLVVMGEAFEGSNFRRLCPEPSPKEEKEGGSPPLLQVSSVNHKGLLSC